jgi:hypothetical protein
MRRAALRDIPIPTADASQRIRALRREVSESDACATALELRTLERSRGMAAELRRAKLLPVAETFPNTWTLGPDQEWVIEARDGRWEIVGSDPWT